MFYRQLAEVSVYISDSHHDLQEVLQMLCLKAMSGLQVDALVYEELDSVGHLRPSASFGIEISDKTGLQPSFNISESTPCADAIKSGRIIWLESLPNWPKSYSAMKSINLPKSFRTLICCPVENRGLPIGCISIFSNEKLSPDESISQFIEALSMILANAAKATHQRGANQGTRLNHLNSHTDDSILTLREYQEPLTERQNLILKLISEGRTNAAIADVLGYSESLIRQETIKIYAKLGCSGRNEAAQIFLKSLNSSLNSTAV